MYHPGWWMSPEEHRQSTVRFDLHRHSAVRFEKDIHRGMWQHIRSATWPEEGSRPTTRHEELLSLPISPRDTDSRQSASRRTSRPDQLRDVDESVEVR